MTVEVWAGEGIEGGAGAEEAWSGALIVEGSGSFLEEVLDAEPLRSAFFSLFFAIVRVTPALSSERRRCKLLVLRARLLSSWISAIFFGIWNPCPVPVEYN